MAKAPSFLKPACHFLSGFMLAMAFGAMILNGYTLGWDPQSKSSALWEARVVRPLEGLPRTVLDLLLFMRTPAMCRVIYSVLGIQLTLWGYRFFLAGSRVGRSVRQLARAFIRQLLLPMTMVGAYYAYADSSRKSQMPPIDQPLPDLASTLSEFATLAQNPPTCYQVANALVGDRGFWAREAAALALIWSFYYVFIHVLYYVAGYAMRKAFRLLDPSAENLKVPWKLQAQKIYESELAFPMYSLVPAVGDMLRQHGFSRTTNTFAEAGGFGQSLINFALYMFLVEGGVFFVHYWMLHKWHWGKENLNHDEHHKYVHDDEMTSWSGYAFEAIDGTLQGIPFVMMQFLVPVPQLLTTAAGAFVGVWTLYIHVGVPGLPWPFMGSDYHNIHHVYNWYNFGLFTQLWDWMYNTLKHPSQATIEFTDKQKKKRGGRMTLSKADLRRLHTQFTNEKEDQHAKTQ